MLTLLGPHAADGGYANNASGRWILKDLVRDLQPAWVNILRAQQPNDALATALEIRRDYPRTGVMIRHMFGHLKDGDENLLKVFKTGSNLQRASEIYRAICTQYLGLDLVLVVGNEITLADYSPEYVPIFIELMRLASADGLQLAVGRFPAGHPHHKPYDPDEQFPQLAALGNAFVKHRGHYFSPNWYYTRTWFDAITKGLEFWEFIGKPKIVIGEFGILLGHNTAEHGWKSVGLTATEAADNLVDVTKKYLLPNNIPACWFNIYKWYRSNTFETNGAVHKRLFARRHEIQMTTFQPIPVLPAKGASVWKVGRLISINQTRTQNIRNAPFAEQTPERPKLEVLAAVPDGALIYVYHPGPTYVEDGFTWFGVWYPKPGSPVQDIIGWMALVRPYFSDQFTLDETPPDEEPPDDPIILGWRKKLNPEFFPYLAFAEATANHSLYHQLIIEMARQLDKAEENTSEVS